MVSSSKPIRKLRSTPLTTTYITSTLLSLITYYLCAHYYTTTPLRTAIATAVAAYMPSYLDGSEYDCNNQRYWPALVRWTGWRRLFRYFTPQLICDHPATIDLLKSGKQHIVVSHPHGVASYNHFLLMTDAVGFQSQYTPKPRRELIANVLFKLPYLRELTLWLGCIDASKPIAERALKGGHSVQVYPGGEHEQLLSNPTQPTLVIRKRKGIARLALKHNLPLVPCFTFGEDQCYNTYSALLPVQLWLSKNFKIAVTAATGQYYIPFFPYRQQLTTVVGKPIQLPSRVGKPASTGGVEYTDGDVKELLELYVGGMTDLFDQYKDKYSKYKVNTLKVI